MEEEIKKKVLSGESATKMMLQDIKKEDYGEHYKMCWDFSKWVVRKHPELVDEYFLDLRDAEK